MQQLVTLGSILFCNCYLFDWFAGALFFLISEIHLSEFEKKGQLLD